MAALKLLHSYDKREEKSSVGQTVPGKNIRPRAAPSLPLLNRAGLRYPWESPLILTKRDKEVPRLTARNKKNLLSRISIFFERHSEDLNPPDGDGGGVSSDGHPLSTPRRSGQQQWYSR